MQKQKYLAVLPALRCVFVLTLLAMNGCDTQSPALDAQAVGDLKWKPNASGMMALIEQTSQAALQSGATTQAFDVFSVDANGGIGQKLPAPGQSVPQYVSGIFLSSDGSRAVTTLGSNIFRLDVASGTWTSVIDNAYLLGVSRDAKYVTTLQSNGIVKIYDVLAAPARLIAQITTVALDAKQSLWLDNGQFTLNFLDSLQRPLLRIYDTTRAIVKEIPNASTPFHASGYAPGSRDLFVANSSHGIDRINLDTYARSAMYSGDANSFDVSQDGRVIVYVANDSTANGALHILNTANGHESITGDKAIAVFLSPQADRVAYIHYVDGYNSDIHVTGVTVPQ